MAIAYSVVGAWAGWLEAHPAEARCAHEAVLYTHLHRYAKLVREYAPPEFWAKLMSNAAKDHAVAVRQHEEEIEPLVKGVSKILSDFFEQYVQQQQAGENKPADTPMEDPAHPEQAKMDASVKALLGRPVAEDRSERPEGDENE